jgi:RNA-binding protein 39
MAKLARDEVKSTNVKREPRPPSESLYILFKNMFDPSEETEKNWDKELADDVRLECETYGIVKELKVDKQTKCGQIYIKCQDTRHARKVLDAINGRYFEGRKVEGLLMREAEYKSAISKLR